MTAVYDKDVITQVCFGNIRGLCVCRAIEIKHLAFVLEIRKFSEEYLFSPVFKYTFSRLRMFHPVA